MDAIGAHAPEPDDNHMFKSIVARLDMDQDAVEQAATAGPEPAPEPVPAATTPPRTPVTPAPADAPPVTRSEPEPPHVAAAPPPPAPVPAPVPTDPQPAAPLPVSHVGSYAAQPPKRTIRDALVDRIDRRSSAKAKKTSPDTEQSVITPGAFAAVTVMTLVVAGLAFVLSFDMMWEAAKHYGWNKDLAKLFPIIIDVGAVGGTFMGAISANVVYRRIGHQVLIVTLAASVLFNLVGHDIKGGVLVGLPTEWSWTGTVAAVLIPMLLAYFVHAFSKALKTFTDQRRAAKQAELDRLAAVERERAQRVEAERKRIERLHARPAPGETTQELPKITPRPAEPSSVPAQKPTRTPSNRPIAKADAVRFGVDQRISTPAKLRDALSDAGYVLPASSTTVENWCRDIKTALANAT